MPSSPSRPEAVVSRYFHKLAAHHEAWTFRVAFLYLISSSSSASSFRFFFCASVGAFCARRLRPRFFFKDFLDDGIVRGRVRCQRHGRHGDGHGDSDRLSAKSSQNRPTFRLNAFSSHFRRKSYFTKAFGSLGPKTFDCISHTKIGSRFWLLKICEPSVSRFAHYDD